MGPSRDADDAARQLESGGTNQSMPYVFGGCANAENT
jgi:hypothetical protein